MYIEVREGDDKKEEEDNNDGVNTSPILAYIGHVKFCPVCLS